MSEVLPSMEELLKRAEAKGKNEALDKMDKLVSAFCNTCSDDCYYCHINKIYEFTEQIKEQTDDRE